MHKVSFKGNTVFPVFFEEKDSISQGMAEKRHPSFPQFIHLGNPLY
jgi:hypothetical protein